MANSTITKEQLIENGWTINEPSDMFHAEKDLIDYSQFEEGEEPDGDLKMILHSFSGQPLFGLLVTDGSIININPASIEELNAWEKQIINIDPPY
jgi:hypothetical protein